MRDRTQGRIKKTGVVCDKGQVGLALGMRPANVLIPRGHLPGGCAESQCCQKPVPMLVATANQISHLRSRQWVVTQISIWGRTRRKRIGRLTRLLFSVEYPAPTAEFLGDDMAKGFYSVQTVDPEDPTNIIEVLFPRDLAMQYGKTKPVRLKNVEAAVEVLESPQRIYRGIRTRNPGGWCYVGRPEQIYVKPYCKADLPDHLLFAVYVSSDYHIYEWRPDKVDSDDPLEPINADSRFEGIAWQRTS